MRLIKTASGKKRIKISHLEWAKIGLETKWMRTAQSSDSIPLPEDSSEIMEIIDSFGTKRFMIGYRKKDGSYRVMHAQRRVNKYQKDKNYTPDPAKQETRDKHGLALVYDLDVASKQIRQNKKLLDSIQDEEEKAKTREKLLRRAYRTIYPEKIEMLKGNGKTWIVQEEESLEEESLEEESLEESLYPQVDFEEDLEKTEELVLEGSNKKNNYKKGEIKMKLTKTANKTHKLKISRTEWLKIGNQNGWLNKSAIIESPTELENNSNMDFNEFLMEFQILCGQYLIAPNMALENDAIKEAFRNRDMEAIEFALENEF